MISISPLEMIVKNKSNEDISELLDELVENFQEIKGVKIPFSDKQVALSNIGLIKKSPDEFQVYKKKPLSVPPTFELRPPLDSELATEDSDLDNVIFREEANIDGSLTIGDEVLLISIGGYSIFT